MQLTVLILNICWSLAKRSLYDSEGSDAPVPVMLIPESEPIEITLSLFLAASSIANVREADNPRLAVPIPPVLGVGAVPIVTPVLASASKLASPLLI
jgi:hypothetical protein